MKRRLPSLTFAFALLAAWLLSSRHVLPVDVSDALTWYDTLGFPDAKNLPYVRVATGSYIIRGNQPPENRFAEGFLVNEAPGAFTVFVCGVGSFKTPFDMEEPYPALSTVHFVRKTEGPAHLRVDYQTLDFAKVSSEALDRVRRQAAEPFPGLAWGQPVSHRVRIFALARACLQKGLSGTGSKLMDIAANIPDEQTGAVEPQKLREILQAQMGHAMLLKTEEDFGNSAIALPELLKPYENFDTQYPASPQVAYARESADLLRRMIAEDAAHHPKPLEQMSPTEQVAENIYQLRNLGSVDWIMNNRYPLMANSRDGKEMITPVHRLVDLGNAAVPQLIEALDNRRFTRCMFEQFNGLAEPVVMRVSDVAQRILEHISGRNFYQQRTDRGKLVGGTTRQLAEAWWAGVQDKGEKQMLVEATSAGGQGGCAAARKLVEKYPDAALDAIAAGIRATPQDGIRSEYVEVAGTLPVGAAAAAFLKSQLDPGKGLYSQVHAAGALFRQGQPGAVPAMIEAWQKIQPRLPTDEGDAYSEVGGLITFLATSGDVTAIEALGKDIRKNPVDVRLAVVKVFLPFPKNGGGGGIGKSIHVPNDPNGYMATLPGGEAGAAIERLLASALDDTERRVGMEEDYNEFSYADPRVCDMAALVLAQRWPKKYQFQWGGTSTDCDAQIARLRNQWRAENGLPPLPPPTPAGKPIAAEALAGRVREVQVVGDAAGGAAKFDSASLKGQFLNGKRLEEIAQELESAIPQGVRGFTFIAERAGDGTGFKVEIAWIAGEPKKKGGWSRDLTVRTGHKNVYNTSGWASENGVAKERIYQDMAGAFGKVLQSETDAPIFARFRVQRGSNP